MTGSLVFELPPWSWSWAAVPYYQFFPLLPWYAILSVLYLGLLSTGCGFLVYFYLVSKLGTVRTSFAGVLLPLVATLEAILVLGAWRTATLSYKLLEIGGGVLIVAGILIVQISNLVTKKESSDESGSSGPDSRDYESLSGDEAEPKPPPGVSFRADGPGTSPSHATGPAENDPLLV